MSTTAVVFPFDNFGNSGTGDGAKILGDLLREILEDTEYETRLVRQTPLLEHLRVEEIPLDTMDQLAAWRQSGREVVREILDEQTFLVWLAGNHLGVLPVYEELGSEDLVLQFDAHLDCYELHDTQEELSHGNWLRELKDGPRIVQLGHRDLFLPKAEAKKHYKELIPAEDFPEAVAKVKKYCQKAKRIWIDVDVDVFDPSICPAVHDPLPCGWTGQQWMEIVTAIWSQKVIGMSWSEFDPGRDHRDQSLNLLGWLLEWALLKRHDA